MIELVVVDPDLPFDLPLPPEEPIEPDPGMRVRKYRLDGPRRPCGTLVKAKWAAHIWSGSYDTSVRWRCLSRWLSEPQLGLWARQYTCDYCGAGIGLPCVARRIQWGVVADDGLPVSSARVVEYHHRKRMDRAWGAASRLPREAFPSWVWWSTHAIGQDKHALRKALEAVREPEWVERYLQSRRD
jgi:hypothetical protein